MPSVAGRGLGWHRDPPKAPGQTPDRLARARLGASPPPPAASCRHLILDVLDQGGAGSCVANAGMQALRASQVRQGIKNPPLGSRLFGYYLARAYDHDTGADNGTFIRNFFQACVKFGYPPEAAWPYDDNTGPGARLYQMPPLSVFHAAYDQSVNQSVPRYERINTEGAERILDIKRAIAAGYCVAWGSLVSIDFCNNILGSAPLRPPVGKPIAGGHALLIAGYSGDAFDVVNSWSESWGREGWCQMDATYLSWPESADFWVCETAPEFSDANSP